MPHHVANMSMADIPDALRLWEDTEGIGLSSSGARTMVERLLSSNPGLSVTVRDDTGDLIGVVLTSHDGLRGYIRHMAVRGNCRGQGIGRLLSEEATQRLGALGLEKCTAFVFSDNDAAAAFYRQCDWFERPDLRVMQTYLRQ